MTHPSTHLSSPRPTSPAAAAAAAAVAGRATRKLRRLALLSAGVALVLGFGLPAATRLLNIVKVADFPLGFYVTAEGAVVLLAALLLGFSARARRLERTAGGSNGLGS